MLFYGRKPIKKDGLKIATALWDGRDDEVGDAIMCHPAKSLHRELEVLNAAFENFEDSPTRPARCLKQS